MATHSLHSLHLRLRAPLDRFRRRGDDGLTDAEREQWAARWRAGQGGDFTAEEWDRYEALARSEPRQRLG